MGQRALHLTPLRADLADTWQLASEAKPPFVLIATWNDSEEGTDIEDGLGECQAYLPMIER